MKETLSNSSETRPSNTENLWDMQDAPAFDPEAAQKNIETARNADFNPEDYKDPNKLQSQLEQLNINKAILDNPAFKNILDELTQYYGLQSSSHVISKGIQKNSSDINTLRLSCIPEDNTLDRSSNSFLSFTPDYIDKNKLIIKSARATRQFRVPNKISDMNTFEYEIRIPEDYRYTRDDGFIDGTAYQNDSSETVVSIDPRTSNLLVNRINISERDWIPQHAFPNSASTEGLADITYSKHQSVFDSNGVEQYREFSERTPFKTRVASLPDKLGKSRDQSVTATMHSNYDEFLAQKQNIKTQSQFRRLDDTTMSITYSQDGKTVNLPSIPIDQKNSTLLTPETKIMNQAIQDALSASSNK